VYVSLYQTHIQKLADAGMVDYDKDTGQITLAKEATNIDQYLESSDQTYPWQQVYLGLAVASAALLAVTALFGIIPELVAATVVILAFVTTVVAHTAIRYSNHRSVPDELSERR
jgi:hypothetical protein